MIAYWTNYYRLSMDSEDSSQKTRQLQIENRPINVSVPTHLDTGFGQFGALRQFLQIKSKVQVKLQPLISIIPLLTLSHPLLRPQTHLTSVNVWVLCPFKCLFQFVQLMCGKGGSRSTLLSLQGEPGFGIAVFTARVTY